MQMSVCWWNLIRPEASGSEYIFVVGIGIIVLSLLYPFNYSCYSYSATPLLRYSMVPRYDTW
jgi:hypothetical protein